MPDQKQINRLKLMLGHAERALEMAEPDLVIVGKLLSDALSLALEMNEPPNPYADRSLRPGLDERYQTRAAAPYQSDYDFQPGRAKVTSDPPAGLDHIDPTAKFAEPQDGVALTSVRHPNWPQEQTDG
jgi:hypothetical protein